MANKKRKLNDSTDETPKSESDITSGYRAGGETDVDRDRKKSSIAHDERYRIKERRILLDQKGHKLAAIILSNIFEAAKKKKPCIFTSKDGQANDFEDQATIAFNNFYGKIPLDEKYSLNQLESSNIKAIELPENIKSFTYLAPYWIIRADEDVKDIIIQNIGIELSKGDAVIFRGDCTFSCKDNIDELITVYHFTNAKFDSKIAAFESNAKEKLEGLKFHTNENLNNALSKIPILKTLFKGIVEATLNKNEDLAFVEKLITEKEVRWREMLISLDGNRLTIDTGDVRPEYKFGGPSIPACQISSAESDLLSSEEQRAAPVESGPDASGIDTDINTSGIEANVESSSTISEDFGYTGIESSTWKSIKDKIEFFRNIYIVVGAGINGAAEDEVVDVNILFEKKVFCKKMKEIWSQPNMIPTKAHDFLVAFKNKYSNERVNVTVLTLNHDDLEIRAGLNIGNGFHQVQGSMSRVFCNDCGNEACLADFWSSVFSNNVLRCECSGFFRPAIILQGESLSSVMGEHCRGVDQADLLFVVGTSLSVQCFQHLKTQCSCAYIVVINSKPVMQSKSIAYFEGDIQDSIVKIADELNIDLTSSKYDFPFQYDVNDFPATRSIISNYCYVCHRLVESNHMKEESMFLFCSDDCCRAPTQVGSSTIYRHLQFRVLGDVSFIKTSLELCNAVRLLVSVMPLTNWILSQYANFDTICNEACKQYFYTVRKLQLGVIHSIDLKNLLKEKKHVLEQAQPSTWSILASLFEDIKSEIKNRIKNSEPLESDVLDVLNCKSFALPNIFEVIVLVIHRGSRNSRGSLKHYRPILGDHCTINTIRRLVNEKLQSTFLVVQADKSLTKIINSFDPSTKLDATFPMYFAFETKGDLCCFKYKASLHLNNVLSIILLIYGYFENERIILTDLPSLIDVDEELTPENTFMCDAEGKIISKINLSRTRQRFDVYFEITDQKNKSDLLKTALNVKDDRCLSIPLLESLKNIIIPKTMCPRMLIFRWNSGHLKEVPNTLNMKDYFEGATIFDLVSVCFESKNLLQASIRDWNISYDGTKIVDDHLGKFTSYDRRGSSVKLGLLRYCTIAIYRRRSNTTDRTKLSEVNSFLIRKPIRDRGKAIGFKNDGYQCYMISILQLLFHTEPIVNFFLREKLNFNRTREGKLLTWFKKKMFEMHQGQTADRKSLSLEMMDFHNTFIDDDDGFKYPQKIQQDAMEVLTMMLDIFDTCLSKKIQMVGNQERIVTWRSDENDKIDRIIADHQGESVFEKTFSFMVKTVNHCNSCNKFRNEVDLCMNWKVNITMSCNLADLINEHVSVGNQCNDCDKDTTNTTSIHNAPTNLIVHLQRDSENPTKVNQHKVNIDQFLILSTGKGKVKYRLYSYCTKIGGNPYSGHYVSAAYRSNDWILFDDNKVYERSFENLQKNSLSLALILMYQFDSYES